MEQPQNAHISSFEQHPRAQELKKLYDIILQHGHGDLLRWHSAMCDRVQELQKRHPDYQSYRLYHLLIGSTPQNEQSVPLFDFEGDDSIEKFVREYPKNQP